MSAPVEPVPWFAVAVLGADGWRVEVPDALPDGVPDDDHVTVLALLYLHTRMLAELAPTDPVDRRPLLAQWIDRMRRCQAALDEQPLPELLGTTVRVELSLAEKSARVAARHAWSVEDAEEVPEGLAKACDRAWAHGVRTIADPALRRALNLAVAEPINNGTLARVPLGEPGASVTLAVSLWWDTRDLAAVLAI